MRRFRLISLMIMVGSIAAYSQIWIAFGWNDTHCRECEWMEHSLRMTGRQAHDYHHIVHQYGQKIEKEARKEYRHWDKAYRKIFDLRMDRDRKLQRVLSPQQFGLYVRLTREEPYRIHDYRGWYENPRYYGYQIRPDWRRYEDRYWSFHWDGRDYRNYRWDAPGHYDRPAPPRDYRYDNRPSSNGHRDDHNYRNSPSKPPHNNDNFRSEPPRNQSSPGNGNNYGRSNPGNNKNNAGNDKANPNNGKGNADNGKVNSNNGKDNRSNNNGNPDFKSTSNTDNKSASPRTGRR